jgi:glycosyltransferase involved in cell wall biosynthesis
MSGSGVPRPVRTTALVVNNPFQNDSRVWKMAHTLTEAGYGVTVVARTGAGLPASELVDGFRVLRVEQPQPLPWLPTPQLPPGDDGLVDAEPGFLARARRVTAASVGRAAQAARYLRLSHVWADAIAAATRASPSAAGDRGIPIDVWQAEGLVALPVAMRLRHTQGGAAVYDARDLATQSARFARLPGPWRALLQRRERHWARRVDEVLTVSTPYADVLARDWGRQPRIVWNGPPDYVPADPPRRLWHERLGLAPGVPVVLYLGLVLDGRGIGQLCQAIGLVPGAVLVVAGYGADYQRFRDVATGLAHADRIHFPGPVAPADILDTIAAADVSAMPVEGDTVNHQLNTPTKLFDAMGAGVPVVASDLPGMAPIVRQTGCGELCDPTDPADIARAIRAIVDAPAPRRAAYREACLAAARDVYAWEHQEPALLDLYRQLRVKD